MAGERRGVIRRGTLEDAKAGRGKYYPAGPISSA